MIKNEDIIRFAKLFSDEITLDNVSRAQLMAMCRMVGVSPYGSDAILRFKLRNKIRQLKADDRLIFWEGVKSLSREELMYACQARGMKVVLSQEKMQLQLKEWIDLSLNKNIPSSLLLLSRAFTYTNEVESSDAIKMALGSLSDDVLGEVALQSSTPENVYEKKLESLKRQDKLIQEEAATRKQREEELKKTGPLQQEETKSLEPIAAAGKIVETQEAEQSERLKKLQNLNELIATLATESSVHNEREELDSLINDHIELIGQTTSGVREEAIGRLNKINSKLGEIIGRLEENIEQVDSAIGENFNIIDKDKDGVITLSELRESLRMLKDKPSDEVVDHLFKVLDRDGDGKITVKDMLLEMKAAKKSQ
jgi:LETM1 and EF-hand domain-containing protein 1